MSSADGPNGPVRAFVVGSFDASRAVERHADVLKRRDEKDVREERARGHFRGGE